MPTSLQGVPIDRPRRLVAGNPLRREVWHLATAGLLTVASVAMLVKGFFVDWAAVLVFVRGNDWASVQQLLTASLVVFGMLLTSLVWGATAIRRARHHRGILEEGIVTIGVVIEETKPVRSSEGLPTLPVVWTDAFSRKHILHAELPEARAVSVGDEVVVLHDPSVPDDAWVPTLCGVQFAEVDKPSRASHAADVTEVELPQARFVLWSGAPELARRGLWRRRRRELTRFGFLQTAGSSVQLGDAIIDLERNFVVDLAVWPAGHLTTAVAIALHQGDHVVRFQVVLPEDDVAGDLPTKDERTPYLARQDFLRIWPAIVFASAAHGETLPTFGQQETSATEPAHIPTESLA